MEILFSFKASDSGNSEAIYIFEIKFLNIPQDASKSEKYKWFLYDPNLLNSTEMQLGTEKLKILQFKEMIDKTRTFQCGTFLDMESFILNYNQNSFNLNECSIDDKIFIESLLN